MVNANFIIFMIFEAIFYLFHFSMLILLIAKRKAAFKGPFYDIFRIVLFSDLMCYVSLFNIQKTPLIPIYTDFFQKNGAVGYILFTIVSHFTLYQFFGHTLMAFNRFTLIWFPTSHQRIWKKQWYIFVMWGLPVFNLIWKIREPTKFIFSAGDTVICILADLSAWNMYLLITSVIYISTTFIAAVLNILSFLKFYCYKNINSTIQVNEKSLLLVSFVIFVAQLLRISNNFIKLLFPDNQEITLFISSMLPLMYGLFSWSGSVSLIILSKSTRKEYISYFCQLKPKILILTSVQRGATALNKPTNMSKVV